MLNEPFVKFLETEKGKAFITQLQQAMSKVKKKGKKHKGTDILPQGVESGGFIAVQ